MKFGLLDETFTPDALLADDGFVAEEKADGMRLQIIKSGNTVSGYTRQGVEWTIPEPVRLLTLAHAGSFHVDGELIGDSFIAFDLLKLGGVDVSGFTLIHRRALLLTLPLPLVRQAIGTEAKRALLEQIRSEKGEGIVFKPVGAYVGGRNYGVKFKLYRTESFRVAAVNIAKQVCELERAGASVGKVVFGWNGWPKVGDLCEVRFDCVSAKGKLMRPKWLGVRHDLDAESVSRPIAA
jgi:ATP-dependent DNA ligase